MSKLRDISRASDVIAVFISGLSGERCSELVIAAWLDGTLVWSDNMITGGPPYKYSLIEGTQVKAVLDTFEGDGLFCELQLDDYCMLDTSHANILIRYAGKSFHAVSCRELFERRSKLVAGESGVSVLQRDRRRYEVLSTESSKAIFSRYMWLEIISKIRSLIPSCGTVGSVMLEYDDLDLMCSIEVPPLL